MRSDWAPSGLWTWSGHLVTIDLSLVAVILKENSNLFSKSGTVNKAANLVAYGSAIVVL